jgi:RNA 2',3'-cyclic 3'-phosphodiesterase
VRYRLFIAIPIPDAVKANIEQAQAELRVALPLPGKGISWTRPAQFHLTLRFLGDVEDVHVEALTANLFSACKGVAPLRLRATGFGFFPWTQAPRVIWVGLDEAGGRLLLLRKELESAVAGFVPEEDASRFSGHVTLGRVKKISRVEAKQLGARVQAMADQVFGEWSAHKVELIRSVLGSGGAQHTRLAQFELSGSDQSRTVVAL